MGFEMDGLLELAKQFREIAKDYPDEVGEIQEDHTEVVFEATQIMVPRETEALASSGKINGDGNTGLVRVHEITYGNSDTDRVGVFYAAAVHEILDHKHAAPTAAKFLESPLLESVPALAQKMKTGSEKFVKGRLG